MNAQLEEGKFPGSYGIVTKNSNRLGENESDTILAKSQSENFTHPISYKRHNIKKSINETILFVLLFLYWVIQNLL